MNLRLSVTRARAPPPPLHVFFLFQEPCRAGEVGDTGEEARVVKVQMSFTEVHMGEYVAGLSHVSRLTCVALT